MVDLYMIFRPSATQFLQHLNLAAVSTERKRRNAQIEHEAQTTLKRSPQPKEADLRGQPLIRRGFEFLKSIFQSTG